MINSVRNTVLSILNKNNYGYISPSDFNLLATQAQMEIFDEYFSSFNKTINAENARISGTDYADINKTISEILENFLVSEFLYPKTFGPSGDYTDTNIFFPPSDTTTGSSAYMINKILVYTKMIVSGFSTDTVAYELIDDTVDFAALGVKAGDIVVNVTTNKHTFVVFVPGGDTLILADDIFLDPLSDEEYKIFAANNFSEAEKVSNSKISLLYNSLLTSPSLIYPAYTISGDSIMFYPQSISGYGAVRADYFRTPKPPKWTYISLISGEPVFDQSQPDYQDFELPLEDEYKLVMKICQYCGIEIRELEVTQYAQAQEQHEQPTFSQKQ